MARNNVKWISVNDKLPNAFELCIICIEYCKDIVKVADSMAVFDGYGWRWWVDGLADEVGLTVTHWMLRPEPPEG